LRTVIHGDGEALFDEEVDGRGHGRGMACRA
jgi:hypothetical protein